MKNLKERNGENELVYSGNVKGFVRGLLRLIEVNPNDAELGALLRSKIDSLKKKYNL